MARHCDVYTTLSGTTTYLKCVVHGEIAQFDELDKDELGSTYDATLRNLTAAHKRQYDEK